MNTNHIDSQTLCPQTTMKPNQYEFCQNEP